MSYKTALKAPSYLAEDQLNLNSYNSVNAKIIFICGREPQYVRNAMIWQTIDAHFNSRLIARRKLNSLPLQLMALLPRLLYHLRQPHDLLVIGFYGHPFVPLARRLTKAPILFDAFVSTFDTLCLDRQIFTPGSMMGKLAFQLDRHSTHLADKVLLDTQTHADYFERTFALPPNKVDTLYLGCDNNIFYPRQPRLAPTTFTVFTYSTYMPLHGIETVIQAAKLCEPYPIRFRLVGDRGPTYQKTRQLAEQQQVDNVDFVPTLPFLQLPVEIAQASVCLGGHFGPTEKAGRVIAGKTYQFMAMGKPVILGDNAANRELFQHLETTYFCEMNNPGALAKAIIDIYQNLTLRQTLSENGYAFFKHHLRWKVLSQKLINVIQTML